MLATIVIGAVIFGFMVFVIVNLIKKAKKGESSCGCGCSGCSSTESCHEEK